MGYACTPRRYRRAGQPLVGDDADAAAARCRRRRKLGDHIAGPAQRDARRRARIGRQGISELFRARVDLADPGLLAASPPTAASLASRPGPAEIQGANRNNRAGRDMALDDHFLVFPISVFSIVFSTRLTHQYTGPAINETLS